MKKEAQTQYTRETLDALYAMGYNLYENAKYAEAVDVFRVLTLFEKEQRKNWMGLGAAYQMQKEYDRALQSYAYAALLDENDPYAPFHAAECFFSQEQNEKGSHVLNVAKTIALRNKNMYNQLLMRIELFNRAPENKSEDKIT